MARGACLGMDVDCSLVRSITASPNIRSTAEGLEGLPQAGGAAVFGGPCEAVPDRGLAQCLASPMGEGMGGGGHAERVSQLVCLMLCGFSLHCDNDRAHIRCADAFWVIVLQRKAPMTMPLKSFLF